MLSFAADVSLEEACHGFERAEHPIFGPIVFARIRDGLLAIKTVSGEGAVRYQICDDRGTPLYAAAGSLVDLEHRFGLGDRKTA